MKKNNNFQLQKQMSYSLFLLFLIFLLTHVIYINQPYEINFNTSLTKSYSTSNKDYFTYIYFLDLRGVRVSLRALRLIQRVLKLTTM